MARVDYEQMAAVYERGRAMPLDALEDWRAALAAYLPPTSGLPVLDLGADTGLFATALATWFEVRVVGVEPSAQTRRHAHEARSHPRVTYVGGEAERLPLLDHCCGGAWLSTVIHHISDLPAAPSSCAGCSPRMGRCWSAAPFQPEIVAFSAQPFWLIWPGQQDERKHAPDFFARCADGTGVVIDVRPDDLVDAEAAEAFEAAASACHQAGWEFRHTGGPAGVLAANVRWLAGYRHPRCHRPEIADALLERFVEPTPLFAGAAAVGDRLAVLPVLYHLLWRHVLATDLTAAPLAPSSLVHVAEAAR